MSCSVHLIIGTKAQFIKMAPLAFLMQQERIPYRIIDLSQHGALTGKIITDFGLNPDIRFVHPTGRNVSTYGAALRWTVASARELLRRSEELRLNLLIDDGPAVALVHGDTLSTLVGTYLARRLRLRVGLVEAGLSSGNMLSPFPEEAIRRHVEARVEFLFATSTAEEQRLRKRAVPGKVFNTEYNTGRDAFHLILRQPNGIPRDESPYTVLTLHRSETITRRRRLRAMIDHVCALAHRLPHVRFYLHEPTLRALRRTRLIERIDTHTNMSMSPLLPYADFARVLAQADYILTDGGSVQEEASYAGKPCLILRTETERSHGLGTTAQLTSFDVDRDAAFLRSVKAADCPLAADLDLEASRTILRAIGAT